MGSSGGREGAALTTRPGTFYEDCGRLASEKAVVLFTSDRTGTRETWCPDCSRAFDPVREVAESAGWAVMVCEVGSKTAWKDAAHPFRYGRPKWQSSGTRRTWPRARADLASPSVFY